MTRKHVQKHLAKLKKHHEKHKKKLWKLFVKIGKNKNSYRPVVPKKRGGVMKRRVPRAKAPTSGYKQQDYDPWRSAYLSGNKGKVPASTRAKALAMAKADLKGRGLVQGQGLKRKRRKKKGSGMASKVRPGTGGPRGRRVSIKPGMKRRDLSAQQKQQLANFDRAQDKRDMQAYTKSNRAIKKASYNISLGPNMSRAKPASGLVSGQGLRRKKTTKRGPKKPKWISRKTIPKKFPPIPKNWHKKAAGVGSFLSGLASKASATYNKHNDTINAIGSAVGRTALDLGTTYIKGKIEQGKQAASAQLAQFQNMAQNQFAQGQQRVQQYQQQAQGMYQQGMQQATQYGQAAYDRAQGQAQQFGQQAYGQAQNYGQQAYGQAQNYGQAAYDQARGYAGGY